MTYKDPNVVPILDGTKRCRRCGEPLYNDTAYIYWIELHQKWRIEPTCRPCKKEEYAEGEGILTAEDIADHAWFREQTLEMIRIDYQNRVQKLEALGLSEFHSASECDEALGVV